MRQLTSITVGAALAVGLALGAYAEDAGDVYTLDVCPVAGQKLGSMGDPVVYDHEGREIRFCCAGCIGSFEDNPEEYIAEIDEKMTERQKPHYPVETCINMGDELTGDNTVSFVHNNRLFLVCCSSCVNAIKSEPAGHFAKLDEAVAEAQSGEYPLDTCVVSGQELDSMGGPVNYVMGNRLVKLCCAGCVNALEEDPAGHLAKIDEAG